MELEIPDIGSIRSMLFIAGFVTALYLLGLSFLAATYLELSPTNQALVLATVLGSFGTLLLALATFVNIFQTNRSLELQETEREKPLVVDELSYLIQPAINSLKNNLRVLEESENPGCAFDWVYVSGATLYSVDGRPESVRTPDSLPLARLAAEDRELFGTLRAHDNIVERVSQAAGELHNSLEPEIRRLLDEEGIQDMSQSLKVVTSAVIKELDHFGDNHDLFDFWERHGDHLIEYANERTTTTLDEVKSGEEVYGEYVEEALRDLKQRKAKMKHEYRISEDEITPVKEDDFFDV